MVPLSWLPALLEITNFFSLLCVYLFSPLVTSFILFLFSFSKAYFISLHSIAKYLPLSLSSKLYFSALPCHFPTFDQSASVWHCFILHLLITQFLDTVYVTIILIICSGKLNNISNNPSFRLKHRGVTDGSDSSDTTSYPLTENYNLPIAQAMGHVAYSPPLLCAWYTHHQNDTCVTLLAGAAVML